MSESTEVQVSGSALPLLPEGRVATSGAVAVLLLALSRTMRCVLSDPSL